MPIDVHEIDNGEGMATFLMVHHLNLACQLFEDGYDDDGKAAIAMINVQLPDGFREAALAFNASLVNYYKCLAAENDNDN